MKYTCTCGEPLVYLLVKIWVTTLIFEFNLGNYVDRILRPFTHPWVFHNFGKRICRCSAEYTPQY